MFKGENFDLNQDLNQNPDDVSCNQHYGYYQHGIYCPLIYRCPMMYEQQMMLSQIKPLTVEYKEKYQYGDSIMRNIDNIDDESDTLNNEDIGNKVSTNDGDDNINDDTFNDDDIKIYYPRYHEPYNHR